MNRRRRLVLTTATVLFLAVAVAPAFAAEKLLGLRLEEARKTDFFTFFHLKQTDSGTDEQKRAVLAFKPEDEEFAKLVTVKVVLDSDQVIIGMELAMARAFVDHPVNGIFASDIANSMLRAMLPEKDAAQVKDFLNEVELLLVARASKLPNPPTAGYQTYLGKRDSHEETLERTKLGLRNVTNNDGILLLIRVERKKPAAVQ